MPACCRFVILRHTYTCLFHSDLLTVGRGWEVNLDATLRHTDTHTHTHTHTHRQNNPKMHQHVDGSHRRPRAAGSEVIIRAGSICSLTPAVYLDYRNINRVGLTESTYQSTEAHSSQSGWQGNAAWCWHFQITQCKKDNDTEEAKKVYQDECNDLQT